MPQSTVSQRVVNGIDVEHLNKTVAAITDARDLARFQFRATNTWVSGGHNRSTIKGFYGAGHEDQTRTEPFVLEADEPPVLLGRDQGPNPVEFVLHALAACLTTSLVYHAAARGIRIDAVRSELEGDLDLQGFLGLSDRIRPGYQNLRVTLKVTAEAPVEQLRALCQYSPVFDIVSNPVPVTVHVERA